LADHDRIYDCAVSNFWYYFVPSLAVNAAGEMVMGFSGSRESDFIGAFYSGRPTNGLADRPILIHAGLGPKGDIWGDYSATTVDPDGIRFWTVQEYAESPFDQPSWGTWIAKVKLRSR
jgi:hypothetical protein